jgi:hypothetical protein
MRPTCVPAPPPAGGSTMVQTFCVDQFALMRAILAECYAHLCRVAPSIPYGMD